MYENIEKLKYRGIHLFRIERRNMILFVDNLVRSAESFVDARVVVPLFLYHDTIFVGCTFGSLGLWLLRDLRDRFLHAPGSWSFDFSTRFAHQVNNSSIGTHDGSTAKSGAVLEKTTVKVLHNLLYFKVSDMRVLTVQQARRNSQEHYQANNTCQHIAWSVV